MKRWFQKKYWYLYCEIRKIPHPDHIFASAFNYSIPQRRWSHSIYKSAILYARGSSIDEIARFQNLTRERIRQHLFKAMRIGNEYL